MNTRDASGHCAYEHACDGVSGEPYIDMVREAQAVFDAPVTGIKASHPAQTAGR
jgi:hypothetical protein